MEHTLKTSRKGANGEIIVTKRTELKRVYYRAVNDVKNNKEVTLRTKMEYAN